MPTEGIGEEQVPWPGFWIEFFCIFLDDEWHQSTLLAVEHRTRRDMVDLNPKLCKYFNEVGLVL